MTAVAFVPPTPNESRSTKPVTRGTSNSNARGGSAQRRRRREWLVETYRADVDLWEDPDWLGLATAPASAAGTLYGNWRKCCRCYRCGELLTVDTVTVDRIIPGCQGGTYRRTNIRPACGQCNSEAGGGLRGKG